MDFPFALHDPAQPHLVVFEERAASVRTAGPVAGRPRRLLTTVPAGEAVLAARADSSAAADLRDFDGIAAAAAGDVNGYWVCAPPPMPGENESGDGDPPATVAAWRAP